MYKKILVALIACGFMSMAYAQSIINNLDSVQTYHKPEPEPHHPPKPAPKKPKPKPQPKPEPKPEPRH